MKRSNCSWYLKDVPHGWKAESEQCDDEISGAFSVLSVDQVLPVLEGTHQGQRLISQREACVMNEHMRRDGRMRLPLVEGSVTI